MHDDMPPLPKFLKRKKTPENRAIVDAILKQQSAKRDWAPMRKPSEIAPRPSMPINSERPDLPVKVQVKEAKRAGSTLLATYANMAEFTAKHNLATYPLRGQPVVLGNHTIVLVSAKPWADKEKNLTKREGPPSSAVNADGVVYGSVLKAFEALKLPIPKHQKFRAELKAKRALDFVHDGVKYAFTYDLDAKPPKKAGPVVEPAAKKKVAPKQKGKKK